VTQKPPNQRSVCRLAEPGRGRRSLGFPFARQRYSLAAALCVLFGIGCTENEGPGHVFHNGHILTMETAQPEASAFAIRDGLITAVGSSEEILALETKGAAIHDLAGRTVVPGFNDAHLHALLTPPGAVSLAEAKSIDQLLELLRVSGNGPPDRTWIIGGSYDDVAVGRHPTRLDLDRVSTERPVLAIHASGHLFAVNTYALERAALPGGVEVPDGGQIYRDEEGNPTGLLAEFSALTLLFADGQPSPFASDFDSALETLENFYRQALSQGITSFTDAKIPTEVSLVYWRSDPERHGVRVNLLMSDDDLDSIRLLTRFARIAGAFGWVPFDNPWLRARGVKINHGMSLSGRTARQYEPYHNRPNYYGLPPQRDQDTLNALIATVHALDLQAAVHTNGDYEIDMVLEAIEKAIRSDPREHRHRIEHGSIVNDSILARMKDAGIVIAPHSYIYEKGPMIEPYGPALWPRMFPNASTFEYGIPNAGNSDYPISGLSPMLRIQSLVTRTSRGGRTYGPEQRLSVEQALYVYTMGGAFASFEETRKGSIKRGKFADFVVLSDDPRSVPALELKDVAVEETWVAGRMRYTALH
jgi:predicted amidohydrolase YtcJ